MQIPFNSPRSNSATNSPPCPDVACCKHATLHRLASYERFKFDPVSLDFIRVTVQRWICKACGSTYSVIPKDMLPYRQIPVSVMEQGMDHFAAAKSKPPPAAAQAPKGPKGAGRKVVAPRLTSTAVVFYRRCLRRIKLRITERIPLLCGLLGLLLDSSARSGLRKFWLAWRTLGDSANSLAHLADHFTTSLLLDYKSLRPSANAQIWPKPSPI